MMCCSEERGKTFWMKRAPFILLAVVAGVAVFGWVVMLLWNWLLPAVFGIGTLTFWQALGILVLAKILFGGCCGGHRGHHHMRHGHEFRNKWMNLTPEEREKMKEEWHNRCCTPAKPE
jgi:Ca2+/H+ antiporter, TMEM165/GDT1 family